MADRRKKDKLEKFRRELLESSDLDDATVDAVIEMGFEEIHTLRHLPKSHVMNMEGLTLAQKFILIGEIEKKNKGMSGGNSRSTGASCSVASTNIEPSMAQKASSSQSTIATSRPTDVASTSSDEHVPKRRRITFESENKNDSKKSQDVPNDESHREVTIIGNNQAAVEFLTSAINSYYLRKFEKMTVTLDEAEILDKCKIRLAFAKNISSVYSQVIDFSNNIPEQLGIEIVYKTTYENLRNLANDHAKSATYMEEAVSTDLSDLIDFLFTQERIQPYTKEWDHLMDKTRAAVTYFESLSKAGQCVTKCYVLLFFTVLHNFMATRNRLRPTEHYKLLPFVFACIPFCESDLIVSDAWVKTIFEVYEIAVVATCSSLAAGQIPYADWFPNHLDKLDGLEKKANELGITVLRPIQRQLLIQARTDGTKLWFGSKARMCIVAAHYYYHYSCYKGMMAILKATDQTKDAENIRMNFAMRLSKDFELCVEQHNIIGEATSLENLLNNAKLVFGLILQDHSNILTEMNLKNSNCLHIWVKSLFEIIYNEHINSFTCNVWKEAEKQSIRAAEYIKTMSKPGRCISQAYMSFFVSFCMKLISRRHLFINNDLITELQIILSVIILCEDAFEKSNFSARMKSKACYMATALFTQINQSSEFPLKLLEKVVELEEEYKTLTKQYDEILSQENDESSRDHEEKKTQDEIGQKEINDDDESDLKEQEKKKKNLTEQEKSKSLDFVQQLEQRKELLKTLAMIINDDDVDGPKGITSLSEKFKEEAAIPSAIKEHGSTAADTRGNKNSVYQYSNVYNITINKRPKYVRI